MLLLLIGLTSLVRMMQYTACWVDLNIGKHFKDSVVYCCAYVGVLFIAWHPWQFDKDAHHKCQYNTYEFVHNGERIILTPQAPEMPFQLLLLIP